MKPKTEHRIKRIVDIAMTVLLLFLMAYQVTGEVLHEWCGIGMMVLLIVHHLLNRKWYAALFKGKYTPYRITVTVVNTLLLVSIAVTAFSGMAMSGHAVPFMYGIMRVMTARTWHLGLSHWSFILMGVHLGLHIGMMTAKCGAKGRWVFRLVLAGAGGVGLWLFLKSNVIDYLLFHTHFAFLDYDKAAWLVLLEQLAVLLFWVLAGYTLAELTQRGKRDRHFLQPLVWLGGAVILGTVLYFAVSGKTGTGGSPSAWQTTPSASANRVLGTAASDASSPQRAVSTSQSSVLSAGESSAPQNTRVVPLARRLILSWLRPL